MLTFTLDTNCVVAAVNEEPDAPHVEQLVELARAGKIAIARTSDFEADQRMASDEQRRANLDYLSRAPIAKEPGPLRFGADYEFFNGDVFADDETARLDEQISAIVLPKGVKPKDSGRRMIDVHHLIAHAMAGHDVFVTRDRHMIKEQTRERLRSEIGLTVMTPLEAVALARDQGETTPTATSGPPKERQTWQIVMIIWGLLVALLLIVILIVIVGWFLAADESICLDRSPVWGPPTAGSDPDCSGHIDELLRKWGWVS